MTVQDIQSLRDDEAYSFAYIDDDTKRSIRRAILKAVAIPGHQVPFGSREMPLPYGWGTGGIQLTASIIGRDDVLKVMDQGTDDTTNAVSIRRFFQRVAAVRTTRMTQEASIIQTRHRIPERPLTQDQILIFQVPHPDRFYSVVYSENESRKLHAFGDYSLLYVKLYEDIARWGQVATPYDYPILVNGRYVASPSPIPKFDNPKMHRNPALFIFGAGREKRIYAIPPYTSVVSLDFEDHPFAIPAFSQSCVLCGAGDSYLDETVTEDGRKLFACSDTDYCEQRRAYASADPSQSPVASQEGVV